MPLKARGLSGGAGDGSDSSGSDSGAGGGASGPVECPGGHGIGSVGPESASGFPGGWF